MKSKNIRIRDAKGRFTKKQVRHPAAGWGWPMVLVTLIILVQLVAVAKSRAIDLENAAAIEAEFKQPIELICKRSDLTEELKDICEEVSYDQNQIMLEAAR